MTDRARMWRVALFYCALNPEMFVPEEWKVVEARLAETDRRLTLEYSGPGGRVYALPGSPR